MFSSTYTQVGKVYGGLFQERTLDKMTSFKLDTQVDVATKEKGDPSDRVPIGLVVNRSDYDRCFKSLGNKSGTIRALVQRISISAEVALYKLHKERGYELWEIATVLAAMGAGLGDCKLYASSIPMAAKDELERLSEGTGEDEYWWRVLREYSSCVRGGSMVTKALEEAYAEKWDCDLQWSMGSVGEEVCRYAMRARAGWWRAERDEELERIRV